MTPICLPNFVCGGGGLKTQVRKHVHTHTHKTMHIYSLIAFHKDSDDLLLNFP